MVADKRKVIVMNDKDYLRIVEPGLGGSKVDGAIPGKHFPKPELQVTRAEAFIFLGLGLAAAAGITIAAADGLRFATNQPGIAAALEFSTQRSHAQRSAATNLVVMPCSPLMDHPAESASTGPGKSRSTG
jgi:hypothetical protein